MINNNLYPDSTSNRNQIDHY